MLESSLNKIIEAQLLSHKAPVIYYAEVGFSVVETDTTGGLWSLWWPTIHALYTIFRWVVTCFAGLGGEHAVLKLHNTPSHFRQSSERKLFSLWKKEERKKHWEMSVTLFLFSIHRVFRSQRKMQNIVVMGFSRADNSQINLWTGSIKNRQIP